MKTILAIATLTAATLVPSVAGAQKAKATGSEALVNASSGVVRSMSSQYANLKPVPAKALLSDYLSSKWSKPGDPVEARLSNTIELADGTVLPRGTKLLGHVDQVVASNHGSNGALTFTLDQAKTKAGTVLPIKATLIRVADAFDAADPIFSVELDGASPLPATADVTVTPLNRGAVGLTSSQSATLSGTVIKNGENLTLTDGTQFKLAIASKTSQVASK